MEMVLNIQDAMWLPASESLLPSLTKSSRKILEKLLRGPSILNMSGSLSNYLAKKMVEESFGAVGFTSPANTYLGLWAATLDDTSTGSTASEAGYTSYARTLIGTANNQTDAWNAATGTTTATVTNKNAITCPTSTGTGTNNTITFVAILDASTTGNMLCWASVTSTTINNGDTPKVNASAFSIVQD